MKIPLLFLSATLTLSAAAADLALTLIPPEAAVAPNQPAAVDLVALNPKAGEVPFPEGLLPAARLTTAAGTWPVALRSVGAPPALVAPGTFAVRRYEFVVPAAASGQAVLEADAGTNGPLKAVLEIGSGPGPAGQSPVTPVSSLATTTRAIDAVVNRTFAGRLTPNEPIYFIYGGGKEAAAKFQFSFNYRLATLDWGKDKRSILQLGYTQRSLWDIDSQSSPFYDTSYMPELSVDTLASVPSGKSGWFTWIGLRTGVMHESNGRAGDGSRSLNTFYARPMFALGSLDSWHLVVFPEISGYITNENDDLKNYRGYGRMRMVFGKNNGPSLLFAGWAGKNLDHPTYQFDLAYPIRTKLLNFEAFFLAQYFNGFGESLLSYNKKSHALRFGLELLR